MFSDFDRRIVAPPLFIVGTVVFAAALYDLCTRLADDNPAACCIVGKSRTPYAHSRTPTKRMTVSAVARAVFRCDFEALERSWRLSFVFDRQGRMNVVAHVEDIDLRVFDPPQDLQLLDCWLRSPHVVEWWGTPDLHLKEIAQRSRDTHAVITVDDRPVGYMCWQRPSPSELETAGLTDLPEDLVDIDILLGEAELLGRGLGPRALAVLLAKLGGEGVGFAGVGTSTSNRVAIRAFEKAGFRLFRDFEDPEFGPCKYMLAQLSDAVEPADGADGVALRHGLNAAS